MEPAGPRDPNSLDRDQLLVRRYCYQAICRVMRSYYLPAVSVRDKRAAKIGTFVSNVLLTTLFAFTVVQCAVVATRGDVKDTRFKLLAYVLLSLD